MKSIRLIPIMPDPSVPVTSLITILFLLKKIVNDPCQALSAILDSSSHIPLNLTQLDRPPEKTLAEPTLVEYRQKERNRRARQLREFQGKRLIVPYRVPPPGFGNRSSEFLATPNRVSLMSAFFTAQVEHHTRRHLADCLIVNEVTGTDGCASNLQQ